VTSSGENFTCLFTSPGPAAVEAGIGSPNLPLVSDLLTDPVEPPLALFVSPSPGSVEVGRTTDLVVDISGGVPPFRLAARLLGSQNLSEETAPADGTALVGVDPAEAGMLPADVSVTDALGVVVSGTTVVTANPALALEVNSARSLSAQGSSVAVASTALSGAPPFFWVVNATSVLASAGPFAGVAGSGDAFNWSGLLEPETPDPLIETVVDAAGALVREVIPPIAAAPFSGRLAVTPGPPGSIEIWATLDGGVPPVDLWVNASDGQSWTFSAPADGSYSWSASVDRGGRTNVSVVALDHFGVEVATNATVTLVGPPGSPGASGASGVVALGVAISLGVVGWVVWRRRRRSTLAPVPPPDPEATLRRILEPADGADRTTVELLAEEAGIPLTEVRATIDRLVGAGTIRSETSPDGEEVLAWSPTSGP